jgi:small subunit ribosomal protein S19e
MAASTARTVKDVNPHEFVKAYSAHLKRSGKVGNATSLAFPQR